jgi:hypothetical protein
MKRILSYLVALIGVYRLSWAQDQPVTFSASGDIPYGTGEIAVLQRQINDHNKYSPAAFFIHVGDIKSENESCNETRYATVANLFKASAAPVYIVPGDNETADCSNPAQGMSFFLKYYEYFEQNYCSAPYTEHQSVRPENWAFTMNGVLVVGVNLSYGGSSAQQQAADWVKQQLEAKILQVRAAVIFAHYSPDHKTTFSTPFRQAAAVFGKPILFLHGHGHSWSTNYPFPELNVLRVQVDNGAGEAPVEVTVTLDNSSPAAAFVFKRNPWTSPTIINMPPCANAGADQIIDLTATATLGGGATDDGDPSGTLTTTWSVVTGPGVVTFDNSNSLTTTVGFSAPGTYVLRLTANDSQLQGSDEVAIVVESIDPALAISDVSLNEGNSGTTDAVFTVSLAQPNGQPVTVDYQIVSGTATAHDDYVANPSAGTLRFDGTTTQTIAVTINGDGVDEQQDETFFINLSNPLNATITDNQGVGIIVNDDGPVPPAAPSNLSANANNPTTVTLAWSDHAANEDGFKIERKVGGIFNQIGVVNADVTSYTDTGLNSNTAYSYRVRAYNVAGNSAYTNEVSVATPGVSALTVNTDGSGSVALDPAGGTYINGTVVTLIPQSGTGFRFSGWSGDLSGSNNPATLTMNSNKTVTATFIPIFTLTTTTVGSGTVTLDPTAGIYDAGATVTLTATPAAGYRFSGWSGDLSGSSNPATLTMNSHKTVTATFTRVLTLTANAVGSGIVTLDPPGGVYDENTVVTLTATPELGFQFNGWSVDLSGSNNPATMTMNADKTIIASFAPIPIGVAHQETRIGGISSSTAVTTLGSLTGVNGHLYLAAISMRPKVSVLAVSGLNLNWKLVKSKCAGRNTTAIEVWMAQGTPSGNPVSGAVTATFAGTPSTAVIAVSRYSGVAATNPLGNTLAGNTNGMNAAGACSGGVDNNAYSFTLATTMSGAFIYGAAAIKGAPHAAGQSYIERTEVLQAAGTNTSGVAVEDKMIETAGPIAVSGSFSAAVDWVFAALEIKPQQYTLTLNTIGSGHVALDTPSGVYRTGASATLIPQSGTGFQFSGWSGDLTGTANPATLTMDANKNVTAVFTALPPPRTLTVSTVGSGSVAVNPAREFYDDGTIVTLTATSAAGFQFSGWSGDVSDAANPATLTMNANKTVAAAFIAANVNLAKTRPVTASGTYSGKPPENAVDGSTSSYWRSGSTSKPVWLRVDLGATMTIGRVVINWYKSYYAKNYEIQISNDDVSWQKVAGATGKSGVQTLSFSAQTARYVRLYFTKSNSSSYRVAEFEAYSGSTTASKRSSAEMTAMATPDEFELQQNYPNPFNPGTTISFNLPSRLAGSRVTIKVYTINGAEVATLADDHYAAGMHTIFFNPENLPSGTYFYVMQAGGVRQVRQLLLVK